MSTITRRKRVSRQQLGPYRRHALLTGEIVYPAKNYDGYGDGTGTDLAAFISDEMRADWRSNRAELLSHWASCGHAVTFADERPWLGITGGFDTLPWASEQFDDIDATRRELLALARRYRAVYARDLARAKDYTAYRRELVEHPERAGQGTGCDPQSLQDALEWAEGGVAYRAGLLAALDEAA